MRFGSLSIVFCGAVLVSSSALAADPIGDRFSAIDKDQDSRICWDEFCAVNPNISRKGFDSMDTNKDENLSMEEWRVFYESHGKNVPGQVSSSMMPAQPATPPLVMPPAKPGTAAPSGPSSPSAPADMQAKTPPAPNAVKEPRAPSTPRAGGMPLLTPPSVKEPVPPSVSAPSVPTVEVPKVVVPTAKPVAPVTAAKPAGQASGEQATNPASKTLGNMPLLTPPKTPDPKENQKAQEVGQ